MRRFVGIAAAIATVVIGLGTGFAAEDAAPPAKGAGDEPGGYGAIAYDEASGKQGAAWNQPSYSEAQEAALKKCDSPKCLLNTVEPHHCAALAKSTKARAWSGAQRDSLEQAKHDAVARCQSHAAAGNCTILVSGCND
jgi:hypothetical protein